MSPSETKLEAARLAAVEAVANYGRAQVDHHAPETGYEGQWTITVTLRKDKIVGQHIMLRPGE
jgi:hypothetical protein